MNFGFSYVGLIYLVMLFVPNFFWTNNQPKDYDKYVVNEKRDCIVGTIEYGPASDLCTENMEEKIWWTWVFSRKLLGRGDLITERVNKENPLDYQILLNRLNDVKKYNGFIF